MSRRFNLMRGTAIGLVAGAVAVSAWAEELFDTDHHTVQVETIAAVEHPWGLAFLPDGRFLVTERNAGTIRIGREDGTLSEPLDGVPEIFRYEGGTDRSQAGMFHIAAHPNFAENSYVYFSFSEPSSEGAGTAIARAVLVEEGGMVRLDQTETVFSMEPHDSSGLHFGGRFAFDSNDNTIVLSIGDRRNMNRAQEGDDHAGSFVRIMDDGSTPEGNPFLDDDDVDDLIFAKGNRNSQGLNFHPGTGEIWAVDHGPLKGDEINLIEAGGNYGWPFQTAGDDYSGAPIGEGADVEGFISPVHVFDETAAPSGLTFYRGDMFTEWQGDMMIGGLASESLIRVRLDNGEVAEEEWMLQDLGRRIRDVAVADDGAIWLLTEHEDGEILRLTVADDQD